VLRGSARHITATLPTIGHASTSRLFILTGAPGSGKTAILDKIRTEFRCVDEPAREVLAEQRATGGRGTWDQDPSLFVQLLLQRSLQKYEEARSAGGTHLRPGDPRLRRLRAAGWFGPRAEHLRGGGVPLSVPCAVP
jgi:hypothetical protein